MPEDGFRGFILGSFSALDREVPEAYQGMCRALSPRVLRLEVDGEPVTLAFEPSRVREADSAVAAVLDIRTTRRAILDTIDARHTLASAVLTDALEVRGTPADVIAFHDAFLVYVQGGVRAASFPELLAALRRDEAERRTR